MVAGPVDGVFVMDRVEEKVQYFDGVNDATNIRPQALVHGTPVSEHSLTAAGRTPRMNTRSRGQVCCSGALESLSASSHR